MAGLSVKLAAILLVAALGGCAAQQNTTVFGFLNSTAEYSTLVELINLANLTANLSDPTLSAIILAPNNEAIASTLTTFSDLNAARSNATLARNILSYHVLPKSADNATVNITDNLTLPTLLTMDQTLLANTLTNLTFRVLPDESVYVAGRSPGAVLNTDESIPVGQSIIYPITTNFLIPPSKDIRVNNTLPEYLTIAEALQGTNTTTNTTEQLTLLYQLIANDSVLSAAASNPDTVITLFAPTNGALQAYLANQSVTMESFSGTPEATYLLQNHIVGIRAYSALALQGIQGGNGRTVLPTQNDNETVTVVFENGLQVGNGNFSDAGDTADFVGRNLISVNLAGGKSVIHTIDDVLAPQSTNSTGRGITAPPGAGGVGGANTTAPPTGMNMTSPPGANTTSPPGGGGGGGVVVIPGQIPPPPSVATNGTGNGTGLSPPVGEESSSSGEESPPIGGVGGVTGNTTNPVPPAPTGEDMPPVGGVENGTMPMPPMDMNTTNMPPGSGEASPPVTPGGGGINGGGIVGGGSGLSPPLGSPRGLSFPPPPTGSSPATMAQLSAWLLSVVLGTTMLIAFTM